MPSLSEDGGRRVGDEEDEVLVLAERADDGRDRGSFPFSVMLAFANNLRAHMLDGFSNSSS